MKRVARWIGAGLIACGAAAESAGGTFERWWGHPSARLTNDAERVTLARRVARYRAKLPGYERVIETGEPDYDIWIKITCRARSPAEVPNIWIILPDHPERPRAPHWAFDPIDFVVALARTGEFERTRVEMTAGEADSGATITRRMVVAWTERGFPWLEIEVDAMEEVARTLLEAMAAGQGPGTLTFRGPGTALELHPGWTPQDAELAADMHRHCPQEAGSETR